MAERNYINPTKQEIEEFHANQRRIEAELPRETLVTLVRQAAELFAEQAIDTMAGFERTTPRWKEEAASWLDKFADTGLDNG
jgi:hypothetical protein